MKLSLSYLATAIPGLLLLAPNSTYALASPLGSALKVIKTLRRKGDPEMFPGVHLPRSMTIKERIDNILDLQIKTNIDIGLFAILPGALDIDIPGPLDALDTSVDYSPAKGVLKAGKETEPRPIEFRSIFQKFENRVIKGDIDQADPAEGYLYFGNQDYTKILPMLCQVNPFFASALTVSGRNDEYLELKAYGGRSRSSLFSALMNTMQDSKESRFINVRFNRDMTVHQVVNHASGEAVIVPEDEWNYYLTGATYNVYCYVQNLHALIHVLHYLMCTGINISTDHDESLSAWAEIYDDNIAIKYLEVAALLFDSSIGDNDAKVLTGTVGGLGTSKEGMDYLKDVLCDWGSCKTAGDFMEKFLLKNIYDKAKDPEEVIKTADILTEFRKHIDNVEPFATELSSAMKKNGEESFNKAEEDLTKFMSECGRGVSSIDSISSWVQLMCCTGIIHGSTISYTRLCLMPEVMRWWDIKAPTFEEADLELMRRTAATVQGMTLDRHAFTSRVRARGRLLGDDERDAKFGKPWNTDPISDGVKAVLDKYDAKADALKEEYQATIEKRCDFREFGWILTDHCPDGYDGKQHTITTYI